MTTSFFRKEPPFVSMLSKRAGHSYLDPRDPRGLAQDRRRHRKELAQAKALHRRRRHALLIAKGGKLNLHRGPTPAEIHFGHGCTHFAEIPASLVKLGAKFHAIDGQRWTIST